MSYVFIPRVITGIDGVEKDSTNYLSYYKRALSYLGLSRYHAAISDLNSVLAIQPDFSAALVQRGKILAWQGDFPNSLKDLQQAGKQDEFVKPPSLALLEEWD
jgi:DnaJ homolog subfamily C member 3